MHSGNTSAYTQCGITSVCVYTVVSLVCAHSGKLVRIHSVVILVRVCTVVILVRIHSVVLLVCVCTQWYY